MTTVKLFNSFTFRFSSRTSMVVVASIWFVSSLVISLHVTGLLFSVGWEGKIGETGWGGTKLTGID